VSEAGVGWDRLAREAAARRETEGGTELFRQLLTFEVDATPYALPVERVREIVRMRTVTPVPRVPAAVRGVISLRGEIVQVLDLRLRLGLAPSEPTRRSRVVVVHGDEGRVAGLMVDAVREVVSVGEEALRPATSESGAVADLCAQGDAFVSVLDLDRVLDVGHER
jgi:purine-binding chemotaxis protein CheW